MPQGRLPLAYWGLQGLRLMEYSKYPTYPPPTRIRHDTQPVPPLKIWLTGAPPPYNLGMCPSLLTDVSDSQ